jgi:hypothetical protein
MSATPVTVALDKPRQLAFTQRALFRMGSLATPFEFDDIHKPRKSYAALVAWLWACLVPSDAADFASPEDLAVHVPLDRTRCLELAGGLADAINNGATSSKNAPSSTPAISPSSS